MSIQSEKSGDFRTFPFLNVFSTLCPNVWHCGHRAQDFYLELNYLKPYPGIFV